VQAARELLSQTANLIKSVSSEKASASVGGLIDIHPAAVGLLAAILFKDKHRRKGASAVIAASVLEVPGKPPHSEVLAQGSCHASR
jgi:hypothetical protein